MANQRKKGNKAELWVQKFLEKDGWIVHRARQSYFKDNKGKIYTRSNDIFGVFDLIAKKRRHKTRWIQVAIGYKKSVKEKKMLDVIKKIEGGDDNFEIWLKVKKDEWKIYMYEPVVDKFVEIAKIERGKWYIKK